jgi:hypothetical protein
MANTHQTQHVDARQGAVKAQPKSKNHVVRGEVNAEQMMQSPETMRAEDVLAANSRRLATRLSSAPWTRKTAAKA